MDVEPIGFLRAIEHSDSAWVVTAMRRNYGRHRTIVIERMDSHLANDTTWFMRVFNKGLLMYQRPGIATVYDAIAQAEDWITRHPHPDEEQEAQ